MLAYRLWTSQKNYSHFADFERVKTNYSHFADFKQAKKSLVILLTLNKPKYY